jgi:hypothetical protein
VKGGILVFLDLIDMLLFLADLVAFSMSLVPFRISLDKQLFYSGVLTHLWCRSWLDISADRAQLW